VRGASLAATGAFVAVPEQKSFTNAAKQLGLSLPRGSDMVRNLSSLTGAPFCLTDLIERGISNPDEGASRRCARGDLAFCRRSNDQVTNETASPHCHGRCAPDRRC
jgi:Bacterial regulatory helix-turn-helix protein, lysR family